MQIFLSSRAAGFIVIFHFLCLWVFAAVVWEEFGLAELEMMGCHCSIMFLHTGYERNRCFEHFFISCVGGTW
jgi:hypothetical protein